MALKPKKIVLQLPYLHLLRHHFTLGMASSRGFKARIWTPSATERATPIHWATKLALLGEDHLDYSSDGQAFVLGCVERCLW